MRIRLIAAMWCFAELVIAQQPHIAAVVSAADLSPGVSYGGYATIFGTGLSDSGTYSASPPYPTQLGKTQILACQVQYFSDVPCDPVQLVYVSPSQVNFYIPLSLSFKTGNSPPSVLFSAVVNGVTDDAYASMKTIETELAVAPRVFLAGRDCPIDVVPPSGGGPRWTGVGQNCGIFPAEPIQTVLGPLILPSRANRGAITDLSGNLVWSGNPGRLGSYYTIWMTGLGTIAGGKPPSTFQVGFADVPAYGYPNPTEGSAIAAYAGAVPQFPGLYQVNFQIPLSIGAGPLGYGAWPCGEYSWELSLNVIFGARANLVDFPLIIKNGDVPCKP